MYTLLSQISLLFREVASPRILFGVEVKFINFSMKTSYCFYASVLLHSYQPTTFTFQYAIARDLPLSVTGLLLFALLWNLQPARIPSVNTVN
jgi:hypothetical protein